MNRSEFDASMTLLTIRFKRAYNGDILALVFEAVKNITSIDFERVVAHLLGSCRYAPMVPDFRKAVNELSIKNLHVVKYSDYAQGLSSGPSTYRSAVEMVDHCYPIKKNLWANKKYFLVREKDERPRFIIKSLCDDEALLSSDKKAKEHYYKLFADYLDPAKGGSLGKFNEYYAELLRLFSYA